MKAEEKFMSFAPMIITAEGKMAYLRIGKGLVSGKVWCDYVYSDNEKRIYLHDNFYTTLEESINALYDVVVKSTKTRM